MDALSGICGSDLDAIGARVQPIAHVIAPIVGVPRCKLRYSRQGNIITAALTVPNASPGVDLHFVARIDVRQVRARMQGTAGIAGDNLFQKMVIPMMVKQLTPSWNDPATRAKMLAFARKNWGQTPRTVEAFARLAEKHGKVRSGPNWSAIKRLPRALAQASQYIAPVAAVVAPGAGTAAAAAASAAAAKLATASKVFKMARAVTENPAVASMVPHLAPALDAAQGVLVAMAAAKAGDPRAKQALFYAARKAQQGDAAAQAGTRMAAKVYKLAVLPA